MFLFMKVMQFFNYEKMDEKYVLLVNNILESFDWDKYIHTTI